MVQKMSAVAPMVVDQLAQWCAAFNAPGAGLVIWHKNKRYATHFGFADFKRQEPVQPSTRFNLGSITKLYVATQCWQAILAGKLELDIPLRNQWPKLALPASVETKITARHLLTHRAGFEGDVFEDVGATPDALKNFTEYCTDLGSSFAPGEVYSYCNVGYVILGRVLELIYEDDWDNVLQTQLLLPLGLHHSGTPFAPPKVKGPMAVGHSGTAHDWAPIDHLKTLRSNGPCGATAFATVDDLADFGLHHMASALHGNDLFPQEFYQRMTRRELEVPSPNGWHGFGLGVMHFDRESRVLGHNGAVDGTWSYLRYVPDSQLVIALMVNGGDGNGIATELTKAVFPALSDAQPILPPQLPTRTNAEDLLPYVGRYAAKNYHLDVTLCEEGESLTVRYVPNAAARDLPSSYEVTLRHEGKGRFIAQMPGSAVASYQTFQPYGGIAAGILNFRGRSVLNSALITGAQT